MLGEGLHHLVGGDAPGGHAIGVHQLHPVLHTGNAAGNGGKIRLSQLLCGVEVERAVVGAHGVDLPRRQGLPQGVHIDLRPQGRGAHVLGPLEAGEAVLVPGEGQVLGTRLHIDLLQPLTGNADLFQALPGGQVDDVHRIPRQLPDGQPAANGLRLHRRGAGGGVGVGSKAALGVHSGDARVYQISVFTVAPHDSPRFSHRLDHLQSGAVGDAHGGIGHIDLIGGDSGGGHGPELIPDAGVPVLDGHMESVVTGGVPLRPLLPDLQGGGQTVAPLGLGKVQHAGGSSGQGGTGASGPVVRRLPLGALIHLKMGVRVDEAGKDQLSGGVNKLAPLRREAGADLGDTLPLHPQVGFDWALRQQEGAVLNE